MAWEEGTTFYRAVIEPKTIRGVRVSAEAAQSDESFTGLLQLADDTAINALVFNTKQEGGRVLYDTSITASHDVGAVEVFYDPAERISQAHERGLYTITRIVTFEDGHRAAAFPEERLVGPWLDPVAEGARANNLRPYLQAFWWTNQQIRRSIQAAEDAGTGWLLWNIMSNFDRAAIPTDAEVAG
jgi:hypothetical protein